MNAFEHRMLAITNAQRLVAEWLLANPEAPEAERRIKVQLYLALQSEYTVINSQRCAAWLEERQSSEPRPLAEVIRELHREYVKQKQRKLGLETQ